MTAAHAGEQIDLPLDALDGLVARPAAARFPAFGMAQETQHVRTQDVDGSRNELLAAEMAQILRLQP